MVSAATSKRVCGIFEIHNIRIFARLVSEHRFKNRSNIKIFLSYTNIAIMSSKYIVIILLLL